MRRDQMNNRRRYPRRFLELDAVVQVGVSCIRGRILDVGPGGVFFSPEVGCVDGQLGTGSLEEEVDVGEKIEITIEDTKGQPTMYSAGTVRWAGASQAHGCQGFGVQFVSNV